MKICSVCKKEQLDDQFISKKDGSITKTCQACRDYFVIHNKNNKCSHGRRKHNCRECASQPKVLLATQASRSSKAADKKRGLYEFENHITKDEILELLEDYPTCIWCECDLQYVDYKNDFATLERLSNSIGHLVGNCVISCFHCNCAKKSNGPHICTNCATGESRGWYKMDEGWLCKSCYEKCWSRIQVRCPLCDKFLTKGSLYNHNKSYH